MEIILKTPLKVPMMMFAKHYSWGIIRLLQSISLRFLKRRTNLFDLGKIYPINFEDFTAIFSEKECISINGADDLMLTFYWFWTRKESIIKALGPTLIYLNRIEWHFRSLYGRQKEMVLCDIEIEEGFMCTICGEKEIGRLEVVEINF